MLYNKYFDNTIYSPENMIIQEWKELLNYSNISVEVRKEDNRLTCVPAHLIVYFYNCSEEVIRKDDVKWDMEIENWLIDMRARAISHKNEKLRFSILLGHMFKSVAIRHGDGYLNSAFINNLKRGPLANHQELSIALSSVRKHDCDYELSSYCIENIDYYISQVARKLLRLYDREIAEDILGGAISQYINYRFNIKRR